MDALSLVLLLLLAAALLSIFLLLWRQRRERRRLLSELQAFLEHPEAAPPLNLREGSFALVDNAVKRIAEGYLLERQRGREQAEQTADLLLKLSHQLKTPLSSLKLFNEMSPGPYAKEQQQLVDRMEHLLSSLLKLEKLRLGGYPLRFEDCRMQEPLRAAWQRLRLRFPAVRFELQGEGGMRGDRGWLEEAFLNLFKNACEHMPEGGLLNARIQQDEHSLWVSIADSGGGLPEEELPRLFERFFISPGRKGEGGAGIGLSIVREIVQAHHGSITAENVEGGLRFRIVFPLLQHHLTKS